MLIQILEYKPRFVLSGKGSAALDITISPTVLDFERTASKSRNRSYYRYFNVKLSDVLPRVRENSRKKQTFSPGQGILIILGDGGHRGTGYVTVTKMAHELLTFAFHLNDLIGYQKEKMEW